LLGTWPRILLRQFLDAKKRWDRLTAIDCSHFELRLKDGRSSIGSPASIRIRKRVLHVALVHGLKAIAPVPCLD
jgi:hypothetical protein